MADDRGVRPALLGGVLGLVVVAVVGLVIALGMRGGADVELVAPLTGTPVASASPVQTATATTTVTAAVPTTSPSGVTPTRPTATPTGPRPPTDADAAAYAAQAAPAEATASQTFVADLNGDEVSEVVLASIVGGFTRLDIASWTGTAYAPTFTGEGGAAEVLDHLSVRDINGSPESQEIVTTQSIGTQGRSISVWGWDGSAYVPHRAVDGCWDGSHTYGIVGATLADQRITATCDGSPLPQPAWPSDIYGWDPALDAFAYLRTVPPGGS